MAKAGMKLHDRLVAAANKAASQPSGLGFWGKLTDAQRQELLSVREAFQKGAYGLSCQKFAAVLVAECREAGIPVCKEDGLRAWLARKP